MTSNSNKIIPKIYLFFVFFLIHTSSTYINDTYATRLRQPPRSWNNNCVPVTKVLLIAIQCFTLFLGGFLSVFIIRVSRLLIISFSCLLCAIILIEIPIKLGKSHNFHKNNSHYFEQNDNIKITIFIILFGVFYGFSRFILLVLLLEQAGSHLVGCTLAFYLWTLNLSDLCVAFIPNYSYGYFKISIPLLSVACLLLILGYVIKLYEIDSWEMSMSSFIHNTISFRSESLILQSSNVTNMREYITKLCTLFISFLPYGICDAQITMASEAQSIHMLQPSQAEFQLGKRWCYVFSCTPILISIPLFGIFWLRYAWLRRIYSKKLWRLIIGFSLIFLSTVFVLVIEIERISYDQQFYQINDRTYSVASMSVFYLIPQLCVSAVGEILLITTCGEYMYYQSIQTFKYLSIAFFIGAIGPTGAGGFLSMIIFRWGIGTYKLNQTMPNTPLLNDRFVKLFIWLSVSLFVSNILTIFIMWKYSGAYNMSSDIDADEIEQLID